MSPADPATHATFTVDDITDEEWSELGELAPPEEQARFAEWLRTGEGEPWHE